MSDIKTSFKPPERSGVSFNDHDADDPKVRVKIKVKGAVPVSHVQQLLKGRS